MHDIRNGIRGGVGRFKREVTAPFTKEELAAIAEACDVEQRSGEKSELRVAIRTAVGLAGESELVSEDEFSKDELLEIVEWLGVEPVEGDEPDPLY